jgi:4'-phosphopantetheinyl transferase
MNITGLEPRLFLNGIDWNPEKTHIFKIDVEEGYRLIKDVYREILSTRELEKALRYFHISERKSYLVRKCYLRLILSNMLGTSPDLLEFKQFLNKKPSIQGLEFNSSHSGNYAVIAVGPSSIGIDIEQIDPDFDFKSIADCCFSEDERQFLNTGNRVCNFYYVWTRKEAVLKASAEGLVDALAVLNCLPDQVVRNQESYLLTTSSLSEGYMLTIAAKVSPDEFQYWNIPG